MNFSNEIKLLIGQIETPAESPQHGRRCVGRGCFAWDARSGDCRSRKRRSQFSDVPLMSTLLDKRNLYDVPGPRLNEGKRDFFYTKTKTIHGKVKLGLGQSLSLIYANCTGQASSALRCTQSLAHITKFLISTLSEAIKHRRLSWIFWVLAPCTRWTVSIWNRMYQGKINI